MNDVQIYVGLLSTTLTQQQASIGSIHSVGWGDLAVSSSPRPWIDVFALPQKFNMAVTESDADTKVQRNVPRFCTRSICG